MIRRTRALAATLLVTALVATSACSNSDDGDTGNDAGKPQDKVTYQTAFGATGRDAFAWVAKEKGYFKEAGLDVNIQLGAAVGENLKALAAGKAQFVAGDLIGAWIMMGKGTYKDFKAVAAIHQQTLVSIISLEGNGIASPKDLAGQKIGAAANSVNQLLFPAYAKLAGIDPKTVTWANVQPPQIPGLLASGQVKAVSTFLIGKGGIEKAANGKKAVIMPYSDYLSDLFGNGIFASNETLKNKPDLVKRFRSAMLKALQYTIEHPDEAAAILHKAQPAAAVPAAKGEIVLMTPYVKSTTSGAPIGSMDEQRVARAIAIIQGSGLIPNPLSPKDVVDFSFAAQS